MRHAFVLTLFVLAWHSPLAAQNMPHEVGIWFASNGQLPLITADNTNRGFFTDPTIAHGYYSFESNGVQSLSFFVEHISESRSWSGTWTNPTLNNGSNNFPATVSENLQLTTIGLETVRTFISEDGFRCGAGLGLGYGLGGASAQVLDKATGGTESHYSATAWNGLELAASLRVRYSVYVSGNLDVGLLAMGRYWGFPLIGPLGNSGAAYNGPALRVLSELGYLAGVAVGF